MRPSSAFSLLLLLCAHLCLSSALLINSRHSAIIHKPAIYRHSLSGRHFLSAQEESTSPNAELDEVVKKSGFEVALFKSFFQRKNENNKPRIGPKELLAKFGAAYLITSISLSLVSYAISYVLVSGGIDTTALLAKVGIVLTGSRQANAGTAAIAYAVHKAASPIRFPPTVALTPIVARLLGKDVKKDGTA